MVLIDYVGFVIMEGECLYNGYFVEVLRLVNVR